MPLSSFWDVTVTDTLGCLFGGATLWFAYKVYRSFDVQKAYVNRQLEVVLNLVQEINAHILYIDFRTKIPKEIAEKIPGGHGKAASAGYHFSLFFMGTYRGDNDADYGSVLLYDEVTKAMPFLRYANDPLLPKTIAEKLDRFHSPVHSFGSHEKASDGYVLVSSQTAPPKRDVSLTFPMWAPAFKDWPSFVQCAHDLRREITTWLGRYGAADINFNTRWGQ